MKTPILFAVLLGSCALARANDSAFSGVSGTPKPMKGEHASIAMQSEKIVIVADPKGYSTDVDFVFRNDGGQTSVQMGFPESSYGDVAFLKKSAFLRFATFVDGKPVKAKRIIVSPDGEIEAYWLKTVEFAPRQTRRVRVSYRSPWGGNTEWGTTNALVYAFTGGNWKRKVERSDLEIRVKTPGLWLGVPKFDNETLAMSFELAPKTGAAREAVFRKTWRNWQAQGSFQFGLSPVLPFWMQDRARLGMGAASAAVLSNAHTFRIGPVPADLPSDVMLAPAFRRDGVDYLAVSHLATRLGDFADDLQKYRKIRTQAALEWNAKTQTAKLQAGEQILSFSPDQTVKGSSLRPIMVEGQYEKALYVPIAPVAKNLGLIFTPDLSNRVFDLKRGTWTGQ